jgi:O-antigen ligase
VRVTFTLLLAAALCPLILAFVVACFRDPLRFALPAYAALIPFSSLLSVAPGPFGSVSSLMGLLLGVALVTQLVTTRRGNNQIPLQVPVWLGFLAVCGFSLFWSVAPGDTVNDFLVMASLVLLFAAVALSRFDAAVLRRFETAIVVGGVLIVCYGLVQLLFLGGLPAPGGRAARFGNDLLGANNQAASLLLPLAIAMHRALTRIGRSRPVYAAVTLLLLFGVAMTGSRSGLLATVVVLSVVVLLTTARRAAVFVMAGSAVLLLLAVLIFNPGGIGRRQLEGIDSSGRSDIWTVGLHACSSYCLTGAGWGAFPTVYALEQASAPDAKVLKRGTAWEPHNIYLLAVVEVGVLGLVLLLVGLGLALVDAWRLPYALRAPPVAALLGTVVTSMFLSNLEFKFFWSVLIYIVAAASVAAGRRTFHAAPPLGRLVPAEQGIG